MTYLKLSWVVMNVHKCFRCIQPKYTQSPVRLVGHQQRHRAIEAVMGEQVIGKGIQVIQPIRFTISGKLNYLHHQQLTEKIQLVKSKFSLICLILALFF